MTLALAVYSLYECVVTANYTWYGAEPWRFYLCLVFHSLTVLEYIVECSYYWPRRHTEINLISLHLTVQFLLCGCVEMLMFVGDIPKTRWPIVLVPIVSFLSTRHLERMHVRLDGLNRSRN